MKNKLFTYHGEFYRDYYIDYNRFGGGEFSIQFLGDEFVFVSLRQTKAFIDENIYGEKTSEP